MSEEQYANFISDVTEILISSKISQGIPYGKACDEVEDIMLDWIIVGENRVLEKGDDENEI